MAKSESARQSHGSAQLESTAAGTAATEHPAALELRGVDVAYHGDIRILQDLSLRAAPGRITGIIGPNGAGKSTALKAMVGLLPLAAGEVLIDDKPVTGMPAFRFIEQGVAMVPQSRSLFNDLSVEDNLRLGCWIFRRDKPRIQAAIDAAYERFPVLHEKRRALAGELSGGQQRFLEFARALLVEPRVVLLDEPTAMIAPRLSGEIYDFIATLPEQGITVVLVDQNVRQCVRLSDHLYVLELGRNRSDGNAGQFRDDHGLRALIAEWIDYQIDSSA